MIRPHLTVAAAIAACIAATGCGERRVPPWHDEAGYRWRELVVPPGTPGFTETQGGRSGIRFENHVSDSALVGNRVLGQGAGVALGDADGDGRVDVFLARTEGCSALYLNRGSWRFTEAAQRSGVAACDRHSTGATFADVDGDRDLDLILLATTGPNAIFVNDGRGAFAERRDLGLDAAGKGGTTIAMADADGDGRLDLYVANYKPFSVDDSIPPQQRSFSQLVRQTAAGTYEPAPERRADYRVVNRPDMGGIRLTVRASPDDFYANAGGRFVRVPLTSGRFLDPTGNPLAMEPESFGLAARFADLTGDGAPDLFVANDFEDLDELWINDGRGGFRLADWKTLRQMSNSSMGVDVGDVNGDGQPDLFTVDMLSNDSRRLKTQMPTHTALPKRAGDAEMQLQQQRNSLFLNRGDGTFTELAAAAGVEASGWSWATMLMDVDLDGWQDILVANGHLWDIMDADVQEGLQNRLTDVDWRRTRWKFPRLPLSNVAFRNRGDLTFEDASARWRFGAKADVSHALAAGDLDGDGDLDVVVNRLDAPALVLRNDAAAPRVAVRLVGDTPNTQGVGARVRLWGAFPTQEREVAAGGLYMSHSDYAASLAMPAGDSATLEIAWRDGRVSVIHGVRPNHLYEVSETGAAARAPAARVVDAAPLFEDVSPQLGGHRHVDAPFDDWALQFLLPNALSQLGPGVAWVDLDRDGAEDLVVGAGRGGSVAAFRNGRGRMAPGPASETVPVDLTGVLGLAANGRVSVLAGVSAWEAAAESERMALPSVAQLDVTRGRLARRAGFAVPSREGATGPIAAADYDGDGALDLFVGSRVMPRRYPEPASSALFRGDGSGRFAQDTPNRAALIGVGLVSAAMFADVTGDGHPDLVLAREWDSLLLLLNDGRGNFVRAPDSWGLGRWTGRWNGIAGGDLDGDGRLDLIATNWGRNTALHADSSRPLTLLYGPVGQGGALEPILARDDPRIGGLAPQASFARMRQALPDLVRRVRTFGEFADADVEKLLGPAASATKRVSAVTLDHMVFMNRGDHFEAAPLPMEAQLAPAFYAGVADFDGDGFEDVVLSQNFFPTVVGTPRYDAGRGLLLRGDGLGGLRPVPGAQSGILVYGDQRGAAYADFDRDGRLDLAISQNAGLTKLYRNRAARPGLRVRLAGPTSNPDAIGAQVRLVSGGSMGPVREIQAGAGYWSQNGAVQVMTSPAPPTEVWVRWPGGRVARAPVPAGAREVTVRAGAASP